MEVVYMRRNSIKKMTDRDLSRVMKIWLECNLQAHDFISAGYWKGQYENVKCMIPDAEVYVCERGDKIAGFVGLSGDYIAGIFVDPELQSQGIGRMLLDYVKAIKPQLQLNVYEKNQRAVKFYQREDFVIISEGVDENTDEAEFLMTFERQTC